MPNGEDPSEVEATSPVEAFVSYSHKDAALRERLDVALRSLQREGLLSLWYDRKILPGQDFRELIDDHINSAGIILLLISPDFIASDYCWGIELERALQRSAEHDVWLVPIILRPTDWHESSFAHLIALPTDGKPVTEWRNRDKAFLDIAQGIRRILRSRAIAPGFESAPTSLEGSPASPEPVHPVAFEFADSNRKAPHGQERQPSIGTVTRWRPSPGDNWIAWLVVAVAIIVGLILVAPYMRHVLAVPTAGPAPTNARPTWVPPSPTYVTPSATPPPTQTLQPTASPTPGFSDTFSSGRLDRSKWAITCPEGGSVAPYPGYLAINLPRSNSAVWEVCAVEARIAPAPIGRVEFTVNLTAGLAGQTWVGLYADCGAVYTAELIGPGEVAYAFGDKSAVPLELLSGTMPVMRTLIASWTGDRLYFTIQGTPQARANSIECSSYPSTLKFGVSVSQPGYGSAEIDDVRIWTIQFTPTPVPE